MLRRQAACSIQSRSECCMRCKRNCKDARQNRETTTRPTAWPGPHGPSLAWAAGQATPVTNPQDPLPCETVSSASMLSPMAITSQKICAEVSPRGEREQTESASLPSAHTSTLTLQFDGHRQPCL